MLTLLLSSALGALLGAAVLGFYSLLKLRRGSMENPITYFSYNTPINYMGAAEFMSRPRRRWINYLAFRTIPFVVALFLLIAILQQQISTNSITYIAAIVSYFFIAVLPNIKDLVNRSRFLTLRIFALCMLLWLGTATLVVSITGLILDLRWIAPNLGSVRDNLWSTIAAAIIVIFYFRLTDLSPLARERPRSGDRPESISQFLKFRATKIYSRLGREIERASKEFSVDPILILAILVHEDLNRPAFIRFLENLIVTITPISLTVGIAQVRSPKKLTDPESITEMCRYLKESLENLVENNPNFELADVIRLYNDSADYVANVANCYWILRESGFVC